jgi:hypothetical protein
MKTSLKQTPADNNKTFVMYAFSALYIAIFIYISYKTIEENYPNISINYNSSYTK